MSSERRRPVLVLLLALALLWPVGFASQSLARPADPVVLYFFWAEGCPHCAAAKPALADLEQRYPQLEVRSFEVGSNQENRRRLAAMAADFGFEATGVPVFFLGSQHWVGFSASSTPARLEAAIARCVASGCSDAGAERSGPSPPAAVDLPFIGEIRPGTQSLLVSTVLIAAVDGVNPCSLWVLSILLALTLRTGSRRTTAVTGLVFIFVTGLVYALFIGGIFTVFQVLTFTPAVRVVVAVLAAAFAAINIKDFIWFKAGISLSIPESSKPGIYDRMRRVLSSAQSLPALVFSTVVLAAGVSFVELACTAGFPVLWTSIVTDRGVSTVTFGLLLGVYMLVYQFDELIIFAVAVATMRMTKLQERQGRLLKLLSGMLMLSFAGVMLVEPALLNDVRTSLLVFAAAAVATVLILVVERWVRSARRVTRGTKPRGEAEGVDHLSAAVRFGGGLWQQVGQCDVDEGPGGEGDQYHRVEVAGESVGTDTVERLAGEGTKGTTGGFARGLGFSCSAGESGDGEEEQMAHRGILVGVDGSAASSAAVRWAAREAQSRNLPLSVVSVLAPIVHAAGPWPEVPIPEEVFAGQRSAAQEILDAAVRTASETAADGDLQVSGEVVLGPVLATLLEMSAQAEMLVVGCQGQGAVERALLGSVSSGLVHHAQCPVAVIHAEEPRSAQAPVVVGIDGSPASDLATAIAFDEASRRGVELVALHAWSDMGPIEFASANWAPIEWRNIKDAEEEVLSERLAGFRERYPDVTVRNVVECDRPVNRLLEHAAAAQLLVLGSHGRGGFAGMLLGSVCRGVVNSSRIPVIIARLPS